MGELSGGFHGHGSGGRGGYFWTDGAGGGIRAEMTTVLSAVFASQLGAVLFGVAYVGGDSAHVPGGEDTIGGWRDTGSAQHFADAQDLAWSTESGSEGEGTWAYGLDRDDLAGDD